MNKLLAMLPSFLLILNVIKNICKFSLCILFFIIGLILSKLEGNDFVALTMQQSDKISDVLNIFAYLLIVFVLIQLIEMILKPITLILKDNKLSIYQDHTSTRVTPSRHENGKLDSVIIYNINNGISIHFDHDEKVNAVLQFEYAPDQVKSEGHWEKQYFGSYRFRRPIDQPYRDRRLVCDQIVFIDAAATIKQPEDIGITDADLLTVLPA